MSKKATLSFLVLPLFSMAAFSGDFYSARDLSIGGVGVAGPYSNNLASMNPGLIDTASDEKKVSLNVGVGFLGSDEDELLINADDLEDELDDIDDTIPSNAEADDVIDILNDMKNADANIDVGIHFQTVVPSTHFSLAFVVNVVSDTYISADIDQADIDALNAAAGTSVFDVDSMVSEINGINTSLAEYGVGFGKMIEAGNTKIGFGVLPKFQRLTIYDYSATVDRYDFDDIDSDRNESDDSHVNADAGLHLTFNNALMVGVVAKNIIEEEFKTDNNTELDMETRLTAGVAYRSGDNFYEVDIDMNASKELSSQIDTQIVRAGMQLDVVRWAKLRFGARHDLEDNAEDLLTFGFGFTPGKMTLDVAGVVGEKETLGGAIELGFQF